MSNRPDHGSHAAQPYDPRQKALGVGKKTVRKCPKSGDLTFGCVHSSGSILDIPPFMTLFPFIFILQEKTFSDEKFLIKSAFNNTALRPTIYVLLLWAEKTGSFQRALKGLKPVPAYTVLLKPARPII